MAKRQAAVDERQYLYNAISSQFRAPMQKLATYSVSASTLRLALNLDAPIWNAQTHLPNVTNLPIPLMEFFQFLMPIFTEYGYLAVFVMLLVCGFGLPVPEDITLLTGGVIAGLGYANPHTMVAVGVAGVLFGDGLIYTLGRTHGTKLMQVPGLRRVLTQKRYRQAQGAFAKYGRWVMFVARFLPGLRTAVFFAAGMSKRVPFFRWLFMDGLAALISVPVWVYLGFYGAQNWDWMFRLLHRFQVGVLIAIALVVLTFAFLKWRQRHRSK